MKAPPGTPTPDDERRDRLIESLRNVHITDEELLEWMRGPHQ
jgi:hypothetical protein